ncbi:MAG: response regulator [Candidatus Eremiobacterota bacterium]
MNKKIILLIEDNPDDELLTMRALRKNNVMNDIVICRNGVEAIDYLFGKNGNEGELPQLILLDLKLPKIDGLEVLRKIRSAERTRFLPVVVLTSSKEERDIVESYKLGANSYIQKPVDFSQFIEAVKQLQLYWLVMNVSPANLK